jgi:hypothetical protein
MMGSKTDLEYNFLQKCLLCQRGAFQLGPVLGRDDELSVMPFVLRHQLMVAPIFDSLFSLIV